MPTIIKNKNINHPTLSQSSTSEKSKKSIKYCEKVYNSINCYRPEKVKQPNGALFFDRIIYPSLIKKSLLGCENKTSALYGFASSQSLAAKFINKVDNEYTPITIANLNDRIDLFLIEDYSHNNVTGIELVEEIANPSKDITSREIKKRHLLTPPYSEKLLTNWINHLQKNKEKLDFFSYVNRKKPSTEKKKHLLKN